MKIFRRHYAVENGRQSRPYAGVLDALTAFRQAGIPMAVVTNKATAFTDPLLQITKLASWFDFAISGDTLPQKRILTSCCMLVSGSAPSRRTCIWEIR